MVIETPSTDDETEEDGKLVCFNRQWDNSFYWEMHPQY